MTSFQSIKQMNQFFRTLVEGVPSKKFVPKIMIMTNESYDKLTGYHHKDINLVIVPVFFHKYGRTKLISEYQFKNDRKRYINE